MVSMHSLSAALVSSMISFRHVTVIQAAECCTWNYEKCGVNEWCAASKTNCEKCSGNWVDLSASVTECCTWNYETCGSNQWCNGSESNCESCNGNWIDLSAKSETECCSWDFKSCSDNSYCNKHKDLCEGKCSGYWIDTEKNAALCSARWRLCMNSENCCDGGHEEQSLTCQILQGKEDTVYTGCQLDLGEPSVETMPPSDFCCSWDLKTCGPDGWCNLSDKNCDRCYGKWIDHTKTANENCVSRWRSCRDSTECCNDGNPENEMTCQRLETESSSYNGCQLIDQNPLGSTKGCFEVCPDFSCEGSLSWEYCFIESYNRAFEGIAYINDAPMADSCSDERDVIRRRRTYSSEDQKRSRSTRGDCTSCADGDPLPDDCEDSCGGRRLLSSASTPNEKFRSNFYTCLTGYFPEKMVDYQLSNMSLTIKDLSECI